MHYYTVEEKRKEIEEKLIKLKGKKLKVRPTKKGVYRPQGTKGTYRGIKFDSVWEYAYYLYVRDIECYSIERNDKKIYVTYFDENGKSAKFYPDFIVGGSFVEVKGRFRPNDLLKQAQHPEVTFISGDDIKPMMRELYQKFPNWRAEYIESY